MLNGFDGVSTCCFAAGARALAFFALAAGWNAAGADHRGESHHNTWGCPGRIQAPFNGCRLRERSYSGLRMNWLSMASILAPNSDRPNPAQSNLSAGVEI